jgi:hypothetical protein
MRLVYYQEKLYLSLTKTESEELYHAKGRAIEICITSLISLSEDITQCNLQHLRDLENKINELESKVEKYEKLN